MIPPQLPEFQCGCKLAVTGEDEFTESLQVSYCVKHSVQISPDGKASGVYSPADEYLGNPPPEEWDLEDFNVRCQRTDPKTVN